MLLILYCFISESIVEPSRKKDTVWYHCTFRRVPTIDECYTDDYIYRYEAYEQFKRNSRFSELLGDSKNEIESARDTLKNQWLSLPDFKEEMILKSGGEDLFTRFALKFQRKEPSVHEIFMKLELLVRRLAGRILKAKAAQKLLEDSSPRLFEDDENMLPLLEVAASLNGEIGVRGTVIDAFMRKKHRMAWERRHGPIGTGMKESV
ncbi:hypothetical protein QYM36_007918 [Artemia franciscana]|uniref:Uncharacterized protein n=1 Tax=Artemia franciscana TaxID=6661 RepID=A0AA88IA94_ARTSF|nr:hypothetical protein QYM36_007918 [Artemia franciscana]